MRSASERNTTCVDAAFILSTKRTYLAWCIMADLPGEIVMAHSLVMVGPSDRLTRQPQMR
jgi:hypothetical protein